MFKTARALHFVLKIGSLKDSITFFRDKLKMEVQRHEVFGEGCKAACNGPYENQWTKTMIGYGQESGADPHFVLELTYNYSISSYKRGNDLEYIRIAVKTDLFESLKSSPEAEKLDEALIALSSPDGYKFLVSRLKSDQFNQDIVEVRLSVKDLDESLLFWRDVLQMNLIESDNAESKRVVVLSYDQTKQASISLQEVGGDIDRQEAYGRLAFSIPSDELKPLEKLVTEKGYKVLTPYLSLDTPGKATVEVVIIADPNGHEICFVCEEGFRELSKPDAKIENLFF